MLPQLTSLHFAFERELPEDYLLVLLKILGCPDLLQDKTMVSVNHRCKPVKISKLKHLVNRPYSHDVTTVSRDDDDDNFI